MQELVTSARTCNLCWYRYTYLQCFDTAIWSFGLEEEHLSCAAVLGGKMAVEICVCVCVSTSCRCSEASSKPDYLLDDEHKETDLIARQHRADERRDIFRQFSGTFYVILVYHAL